MVFIRLLFFSRAPRRISKGATLGTYLQGAATFCKDEIGKKVDCHTFKYVLCEPAKKTNSTVKSEKEKLSKWDEYKDTLRDVKCTWLAKLGELHIYFFIIAINIIKQSWNIVKLSMI